MAFLAIYPLRILSDVKIGAQRSISTLTYTMSLAIDQTLNPGSYGGVAADKVYNLINNPTPNSSLRRVASTAQTAPDRLTISHRNTKKGGVNYAGRMIRIDEQFSDPLLGAGDFSCRLVIDVPIGTSVVTTQLIKNQVGRVFAAWMVAGNADKILAGEM